MGAIADYAAWVAGVTSPSQTQQDTKASLTTATGRASNFWTTAPDAGATPTTAAATTRATAGSLGQQNATVGTLWLAQVAASLGNSGFLMICDRLSHQGGLSAVVTTAQTTNLPTAALTRYTSGDGVFASLDIYTQIGTTATTVACSYTNEGGTSGRTSPLTAIGATGFREAGRSIILPLQVGDAGVRSVESVTVTATTGTAGAFGVTLWKPLYGMPVLNLGSQQLLFDGIQSMAGLVPEIVDDACLYYMLVAGATSSGVLLTANRFIEA